MNDKPIERVSTQPDPDLDVQLGKDGSKWRHGYVPLNAVAVAMKLHHHSGGTSTLSEYKGKQRFPGAHGAIARAKNTKRLNEAIAYERSKREGKVERGGVSAAEARTRHLLPVVGDRVQVEGGKRGTVTRVGKIHGVSAVEVRHDDGTVKRHPTENITRVADIHPSSKPKLTEHKDLTNGVAHPEGIHTGERVTFRTQEDQPINGTVTGSGAQKLYVTGDDGRKYSGRLGYRRGKGWHVGSFTEVGKGSATKRVTNANAGRSLVPKGVEHRKIVHNGIELHVQRREGAGERYMVAGGGPDATRNILGDIEKTDNGWKVSPNPAFGAAHTVKTRQQALSAMSAVQHLHDLNEAEAKSKREAEDARKARWKAEEDARASEHVAAMRVREREADLKHNKSTMARGDRVRSTLFDLPKSKGKSSDTAHNRAAREALAARLSGARTDLTNNGSTIPDIPKDGTPVTITVKRGPHEASEEIKGSVWSSGDGEIHVVANGKLYTGRVYKRKNGFEVSAFEPRDSAADKEYMARVLHSPMHLSQRGVLPEHSWTMAR